jgi:hypothetical protein
MGVSLAFDGLIDIVDVQQGNARGHSVSEAFRELEKVVFLRPDTRKARRNQGK